MSHFTVLVVGGNVDEQLAPYIEQDEGDTHKYMEFDDQTAELTKQYETDGTDMVIMPDGRMLLKWDDEFRVKGSFGIGGDSHKVPDGLEVRKIPFKERYATFAEFAEDWHGLELDTEKKAYGCWRNPNAKWDWYSVGGRWTGFFKLKTGKTGEVGSPGIMTDPAEEGYADQAFKCDIDIKGMRAEAAAKANIEYDTFEKATNGIARPKWTSWEQVREEICKDDIESARILYNNHPFIKAVREADFWEPDAIFSKTREQYVKNAEDGAFSTFAVLKDGKWYEKGKMGWWACVSDEKSDWKTEFNSLINDLDPSTLLTVVDCHI